MSAITQFFFRSEYLVEQQTPWSIIQWWEVRRPIYNIAVGSAGLLTVATLLTLEGLPPGGAVVALAGGIFAYGILANICYSFGPVVDLLIHRSWGASYTAVGAALFRYGFVFSLGVTLLPIPFLVLSKFVRAVIGVN